MILPWADNAIPKGKGLQVTVKANSHTGLAANVPRIRRDRLTAATNLPSRSPRRRSRYER